MVRTLIQASGKDAEQAVAEIADAVHGLIDAGREVSVIVLDRDELLSPQKVGELLGFSRQHVRRLIDAGELEAVQLPRSSHWKVPARSLIAFEERRQQADENAARLSRELDELGAPLE
ncbi:MAG: helix-turn-helix domain-containing protein [Gaiellaceae bacterium]